MQHTRFAALAFAATALFADFASAQTSFQKIDIDPSVFGASSSPSGFAYSTLVPGSRQFPKLGGDAYFTAKGSASGLELYKTDGTVFGTQLVVDLSPGVAGTSFFEAEVMGARLYFVARQDGQSYELWSTDGTAAGTQALTSFGSTQLADGPVELTVSGGQLYFTVDQPGTGGELWATDGTVGGEHLVKDIAPGAVGSWPNSLIENPAAGGILFAADDGVHGGELWRSDGTAAGTVLVKDLAAGATSGGFSEPVALGSKVLFVGRTLATGLELYSTDGTTAGTALVADIGTGSIGSNPTLLPAGVLGSTLYFRAAGPAVGFELFQTDGTTAGTSLVQDGLPGIGSSSPIPLGQVGGRLIVSAGIDPSGAGSELYRLDPGGLTLVIDMKPSAGSGPKDGFTMGPRLFFVATEAGEDTGLWATDGSSVGTMKYLSMSDQALGSGALWMTETALGTAVFRGSSTATGVELFVAHVLPSQTGLLVDFDTAAAPISSSPSQLTCVDGERLILAASSQADGLDSVYQWSESGGVDYLSGDSAGALGSTAFQPSWISDHEQVLFMASDASAWPIQAGVYSTDGTAAGTVMLDGLGVGSSFASPPRFLGGDGERMLFAANDGTHGLEPWVTDGSLGGATMLVDLEAGSAGSDPHAGVVFDGAVFFIAKHGPGDALWRADSGVVSMVADINPAASAQIDELVVAKIQLFFVADDGLHGTELWTSDGTLAGTHMVADLTPGPAGSSVIDLVASGVFLDFSAKTSPGLGYSLWRSDGTSSGTNVQAALGLVDKPGLFRTWDRLWFQGNDPAHGNELWSLGATATQLVIDLSPGPADSAIGEKLAVGGHLYFVATTPSTGTELFVSDGSVAGTHVALDLVPGPGSSDPAELVLCHGDVFFTATDATGDRELFRILGPGASSTNLGYGLASAKLEAWPPIMGKPHIVTFIGAPAASTSFLAMSAPAAPSNQLVVPGAASWIDPSSLQILGVYTG